MMIYIKNPENGLLIFRGINIKKARMGQVQSKMNDMLLTQMEVLRTNYKKYITKYNKYKKFNYGEMMTFKEWVHNEELFTEYDLTCVAKKMKEYNE